MKKTVLLIGLILTICAFFSGCGSDDVDPENKNCLIKKASFSVGIDIIFFYNDQNQVDSAYVNDYGDIYNYSVTYNAEGLTQRLNEYIPSENLFQYSEFTFDKEQKLIRVEHFNDQSNLRYYDSLVYENGKLKYDYLTSASGFEAYQEYFWEGNNIVKEVEYINSGTSEFLTSYDEGNKIYDSFITSYIRYIGGDFLNAKIFSQNNPIVNDDSFKYTYNDQNYPISVEFQDGGSGSLSTGTYTYINCD